MRKILVYLGKERLTLGGNQGIEVWPLRLFLEAMWAGDLE
jgi:hypothetical protein